MLWTLTSTGLAADWCDHTSIVDIVPLTSQEWAQDSYNILTENTTFWSHTSGTQSIWVLLQCGWKRRLLPQWGVCWWVAVHSLRENWLLHRHVVSFNLCNCFIRWNVWLRISQYILLYFVNPHVIAIFIAICYSEFQFPSYLVNYLKASCGSGSVAKFWEEEAEIKVGRWIDRHIC